MATILPDPHDPRSLDRPARTYDKVIRTGDTNQQDPFKSGQGMPPNMGQDALPHVVTFQGLFRTVSQVYRISDEALKDSFANARHMRASLNIEECLEQRQRSVCLLDWHVKPEDETSQIAKGLATEINAIIKQLPYFLKYREWLMLAIWYGRNASQHRFRWHTIGGKERLVIDRWLPVHGDKLCYKYEDPWDAGCNPDQVGIRVGAGYTGGKVANRWKVETTGKIGATDYGLAYFLEPWERSLLCIHTHQIEDAPFEAPEYAGWIHGVGLRHRLYWEWMQAQECLAFLMEYLERSAFGLEMWYYPAGNPEALEKTKAAAEQRIGNNRTAILVPFYPDAGMAGSPGVQRIEPSMAGAEVLHRLLTEFFGHRIKRLILGQTLTTESGSTGLGSNLASVHLDTYLQIVRYDAVNLSETLTHELVKPLVQYNFPQYADVPLQFVIETEAPDVESKLGGIERAWGMGLRVKANDIYEMLSIAPPEQGDEVLQNKQPGGAPGAMAPGFGPGKPGEKPEEDEGGRDEATLIRQLQDKQDESSQDENQSAAEGYARTSERHTETRKADVEIHVSPKYANMARKLYSLTMAKRDSQQRERVHVHGTPVSYIQGPVQSTGDGEKYSRPFEGEKYAKPNDESVTDSIARAASETETDPTDAQKLSGNYRKGKFRLFGLEIAIENPKDSLRKGKDKGGKPWQIKMPAHYGYIKQHESEADGDHVDVFVGPDPEAEVVFVVDQLRDSGRFDEHKCIVGCTSEAEAKDLYMSAYTPGWKGFGGITALTVPAFRDWLDAGETDKPIAGQVSKYARTGDVEAYRADPSYKPESDAKDTDQKDGWRTIGGGAKAFIKDNRVVAGCPGLKGENVADLVDESDESRDVRDHRQDVAQSKGLEGDDLTHAEVKQLEDHPHPETGQNAEGEQVAPPPEDPKRPGLPPKPAAPQPTEQQPAVVAVNGKPFEVAKTKGQWFFRRDKGAGWTLASPQFSELIDQQLAQHVPEASDKHVSAAEVLALVKQSPNLAARAKEQGIDWDRYAERFGIEGNFAKESLPVGQLQSLSAGGYLRMSRQSDQGTVNEKALSGQLNPVIITKEPGRGLLVVDGTHSLIAAAMRGDDNVDVIVSDEAAPYLQGYRESGNQYDYDYERGQFGQKAERAKPKETVAEPAQAVAAAVSEQAPEHPQPQTTAPSDKHAQWRALHEQHQEHEWVHIPAAQRALEKAQAKAYGVLSEKRKYQDAAGIARHNGDTLQAQKYDNAANALTDDFVAADDAAKAANKALAAATDKRNAVKQQKEAVGAEAKMHPKFNDLRFNTASGGMVEDSDLPAYQKSVKQRVKDRKQADAVKAKEQRQAERTAAKQAKAEAAPPSPATTPGVSAKARKVIAARATEEGVDPDVLNEAVDDVIGEKQQWVREREAAKKQIRQRLGLTAGQLAAVENAGKDYATAAKKIGGEAGKRMANFDSMATAIAHDYPELQLGTEENGDDIPAALWRVIREGVQRVPQATDEETLQAALQRIETVGRWQQGEGIGNSFEDDGGFGYDTADEGEREKVPFVRDRVSVKSYRRWMLATRYQPVERYAAHDVKNEPRDAKGEWTAGGGEATATAEKRFDESAASGTMPEAKEPWQMAADEFKYRWRQSAQTEQGIPLHKMDPQDASDWVNWSGEKTVKIYRGAKNGRKLEPGDFVTTSKEAAAVYGGELAEEEVPAKHLRYVRGTQYGNPSDLDAGGQVELIYAPVRGKLHRQAKPWQHEAIVKKAIAEGKPVPENVRALYEHEGR